MSSSEHDSKPRTSHDESPAKTEEPAASNEIKNTPQEAIDSKDAPQTSNILDLLTNTEPLVKHISSREEFDQLASIKDKYILVWFSAGWCQPCSTINSKFEDLAQKYQNKVEIWKVDVDKFEDLAIENDITMMPSYMIMLNGEKLDVYMGSKQEKLDDMVHKYLEENTE